MVCRFMFNFFGLLLGRPPFLRMTIVNSGARLMMHACKWKCHPLHLQLNPVQNSNPTEICRTGLIIRNITPEHVIFVFPHMLRVISITWADSTSFDDAHVKIAPRHSNGGFMFI